MGHSFEELCVGIGLPEVVRAEVLDIYARTEWGKYEGFIAGLLREAGAQDNYSALLAALDGDGRHMLMLTVQLAAALRTREAYEERGIDREIFIDTMACFTRFLGEHYRMRGSYVFDRAWWTYRQLNMSIFRLGTLEFEFQNSECGRSISIHIPSDGSLSADGARESVARCVSFTKKYFPEFAAAKLTCHSWLLSPVLTPLLKEDSNILRFQRMFDISEFFEDDKDFYVWLFQAAPDTPVEQLKEVTSLQRRVKELLKNSVKIGGAYGEIIIPR